MTAHANDNACPSAKTGVSRFFHQFASRRRERRAIREVMSLGDHLLRDIGLSRHDVMHALHGHPKTSNGDRLARICEENRRSRERSEAVVATVAEQRLPLAA